MTCPDDLPSLNALKTSHMSAQNKKFIESFAGDCSPLTPMKC